MTMTRTVLLLALPMVLAACAARPSGPDGPLAESSPSAEQLQLDEDEIALQELRLGEALTAGEVDCAQACDLQERICALSGRICALVEEAGATSDLCDDARARCAQARENVATHCACRAER